MNIPQKGWILMAIPLAAQLVFLGVLSVSREHQSRSLERAIHTSQVIAQSERCHRLVVEALSHMRGFVLTGEPRLVDAYRHVRGQIPEQYAELRGLIGDNPDQVARVEALVARATAFLRWIDENILLMQAGKEGEVRRRIGSQEGLEHLGQIRRQIDEFLGEEQTLDDRRLENLKHAGEVQDAVILGGFLLTLLSSAALLVAFSRSVTRRVTVLIDNTRRVSEGKELAPPLGGTDELRQIDVVLHEMAKTIRQKEQENELFVYSVSHDLRSPLVNLQGFSQELAAVVGDLRSLLQGSQLPERVKAKATRLIDRDAEEAIRYIQSAVTRLAGIIDALLRLSRAGRVEFRFQHVEVQPIVQRIVGAMHDSITKSNAELQVAPLPSCWSDPRAIDQVFANLIGNAVNYLDPARPGKVEVGCLEEEPATPGFRTYFVRDNGLGIPEAFQAKVFIAFQRLHPDVTPGEGIGLALVRRVVDRVGGRVWLESKEGQGTTFYLALPTSGEARASGVVAAAAPPLQDGAPAGTTTGGSAEWAVLAPASPTSSP
jgi:signal transduction histidine kinase